MTTELSDSESNVRTLLEGLHLLETDCNGAQSYFHSLLNTGHGTAGFALWKITKEPKWLELSVARGCPLGMAEMLQQSDFPLFRNYKRQIVEQLVTIEEPVALYLRGIELVEAGVAEAVDLIRKSASLGFPLALRYLIVDLGESQEGLVLHDGFANNMPLFESNILHDEEVRDCYCSLLYQSAKLGNPASLVRLVKSVPPPVAVSVLLSLESKVAKALLKQDYPLLHLVQVSSPPQRLFLQYRRPVSAVLLSALFFVYLLNVTTQLTMVGLVVHILLLSVLGVGLLWFGFTVDKYLRAKPITSDYFSKVSPSNSISIHEVWNRARNLEIDALKSILLENQSLKGVDTYEQTPEAIPYGPAWSSVNHAFLQIPILLSCFPVTLNNSSLHDEVALACRDVPIDVASFFSHQQSSHSASAIGLLPVKIWLARANILWHLRGSIPFSKLFWKLRFSDLCLLTRADFVGVCKLLDEPSLWGQALSCLTDQFVLEILTKLPVKLQIAILINIELVPSMDDQIELSQQKIITVVYSLHLDGVVSFPVDKLPNFSNE